MPPELTKLLAAALGFVSSEESPPAKAIKIGGIEFRIVAERNATGEWIILLIQQPDPVPSDETLKARYGLTKREIDVARLLKDRCSNREIADRLRITPSTADRHTERVMRKLGLTNRKDVRQKLRRDA
jgi:DNA-binding CsgD family transcriptional regulator